MPNKFLKVFYLGSAFYTVTSAILLFISVIADLDKILAPDRFLLILLFSFIASSTHVIAEIPSFPSGVSHIIAGAGFIGAAFFCVILPADSGFTATVIFTALVSVAYIIVRVISTSKKSRAATPRNDAPKSSRANGKNSNAPKSKKERKEEEYTSIFSSGADKK